MKTLWVMIAAVAPLVASPLSARAEETEPLYIEVTKLLASDGGFVDQFGDTLAIDGDTLVVGGDDIGVGGAYVFERNHGGSNAWGEVVKLLAPDQAEDFGRFVDMQEDLVAVGANDIDAVGSVYLFERDAGGPGNWGLTGKLIAPDGPQPARIFSTPAIDGNTLLVGALGDEEAGFFAGGAVYVFEQNETAPQGWEFQDKVVASDPRSLARFGESLDIDGDTFVVSAHNLEVEGENGAGAAYVFEKGVGGWIETKRLTAPVPESDGKFGEGVAIEGDLIAAGHPGEGSNEGAVYVYGRDTGGPGYWGLAATLTPSDIGGMFGVSIDADQGTLVIGADVSGPDTDNAGAIYIFEQDVGGEWTELVRLDASDGDGPARFGAAVGISGSTVISGARTDDGGGPDAGAAYVYQALASPGITISGSCPGELTLNLADATPSGTVFVARSSAEGTTIVPGGACVGVKLGLEEAQLLLGFLTDGDGRRSVVRTAPAGVCGIFLQAVDRVTCGVGPVVELP